MQKKLFCLIFFCSLYISMITARVNPDSLVRELAASKSDTARITLLIKLAETYMHIDIREARAYISQAVALGDRNPAVWHRILFVQGKILETAGEHTEAMASYMKALGHAEGVNANEDHMAQILDRMASVHILQKNFRQALSYRERAVDLSRKIGDSIGVAIYTFNLGVLYYYMNDTKKAIEKYVEVLPLFEKLKENEYVDVTYNNIGAIYFNDSLYDKALVYFKKSYQSRAQSGNLHDIASSLNNVGETFQKLGESDSALAYCQRAFDIAEKSGLYELIIPTSQNLAMLYEAKNDFRTASHYHKVHANTKDSVFNTESQRQLQEMSVKYESEKKEKENEILNLQLKNESFLKYIFIALAGLILISALFVYRGYRQKKAANTVLSEKNKIIEAQHKDITDSIRYAQRIQQAILPPDKMWQGLLPDSFVLYKPKDILSGDFYWIEQRDDRVFFAAADCTGHGVPGALMSVVNFNLLNKAVLEQNILTPQAILDAVNQWLTISLHQTFHESAVRDGMDIALCALNRETRTLQFAGAFNGAYVYKKDGSLLEVKGDKIPVGLYIDEKMRSFSGSQLALTQGDRLFIFSDGYADQFGGPKGKKMKYTRLKQYISESLHMTMTEQKNYLDAKFEAWRGQYEQVDDVLVIGVCV